MGSSALIKGGEGGQGLFKKVNGWGRIPRLVICITEKDETHKRVESIFFMKTNLILAG